VDPVEKRLAQMKYKIQLTGEKTIEIEADNQREAAAMIGDVYHGWRVLTKGIKNDKAHHCSDHSGGDHDRVFGAV
jgi:hypothetical protein